MVDLCRHVAVCDSGKPDGCIRPVPSPLALAFIHCPRIQRFRVPLHSDSSRGHAFRSFATVRLRFNLPTCSPPSSELTELLQPTETFTTGLPASRSLFSLPVIATTATGQVPSAGLPPARSTTSFAARAIALQNRLKSLVRKPSFHAARLNLPRREPFGPSFCMCRSTARLCGPFPNRVLSWSSVMTTSSRQCSRFSTPQCWRTTSLNRSGDRAVLSR